MKRADKKIKEQYLAKLELIKSGANINPDETKKEQSERIIRAKKDFPFFVENYLLHYITDTETDKVIKSPDFHIKLAKKVKKTKNIKAIVRWGRGLAKSVLADLFIPLWLWIQDDISYLVLVGNNFDKAKILLSDLQAEFEANELLKHDFGDQQMNGDWEKGYFITKNGFIAKALGMGQSPRGLRHKNRRPDYIVCDDLEDKETVKNPKRQDEVVKWIEQDLLPTMDGSRKRYLHPNNNFAPVTIQEKLREKHPKWYLSLINAYDPVTFEPRWKAKYSKQYYIDWEDEIGTISANAEFNNTPHIEGKIFTEDQIQWRKLPRLNQFKKIVGHWDIAYAGTKTSDFNAVRVWGLFKTDFIYIDSFVKQTKMKAAVQWIAQFQKRLPKTVSITWRFEAQFWNDEVKRTINEVEEEEGIKLNLVKAPKPTKHKYDRLESMHPYYQNGRPYYNEDKKAHKDTQVGLQQLYGIEPGYRTKDDAPDADEQAIKYLESFIRASNTKPRTGKMKRNSKRRW